MADPVIMAIATAVVGKAAESLTDQARECLAALVRRIREKFRDQPAAQAILEAARDDPGSPALAGELARALEEASAYDPEFAAQLRELWSQVRTMAATRERGVVNVFQGRADKVVQLRDVHGDLHIG
ncbi:MAG: hypothetical protein JOY82_03360 [Streptosporangiaceae bacterium]|nr:hypothetical protein [Streptosporangiaceae bacterium]MBV9853551.1 hypothetical protein [Streptosporangiaceae bacterium]